MYKKSLLYVGSTVGSNNISNNQFYSLKKGIAYSRLDRSIRYRLDDVLAFMESGRVEPEAV